VHKSQLILHEGDNVKCSPTFDRPKNLENNNFNNFNIFQKLVVNDDKCKKIAPKPCKENELIFFMQNYLKVMHMVMDGSTLQ
jgi:hypothetical protein